MSFLIDPPLLYTSGEALARMPERAARPLGVATVAVFWAAGIAFWRDERWTRWVSRLFGSRNGRDFMVNSGVLDLDYRRAGTGTAVAVFATYPLWLVLGYLRGRR
jgi:hypothetical protein